MEENTDVLLLQWLCNNILTKSTMERFNVESCRFSDAIYSLSNCELRCTFNVGVSKQSPLMWGLIDRTNQNANNKFLASSPRITKRYYKDNKQLELFEIAVSINPTILQRYFRNPLSATLEEMTLFEIDHPNFSQNYGVEIL